MLIHILQTPFTQYLVKLYVKWKLTIIERKCEVSLVVLLRHLNEID